MEDERLRRMLEDEKLKRSSHFQDRVYRDEPIILRASQMKNYTPREYQAMRALAQDGKRAYKSAVEIFYLQGKHMENFNDDYAGCEAFLNYFPTYQGMTTPQLRTFFSFRTRLREWYQKTVAAAERVSDEEREAYADLNGEALLQQLGYPDIPLSYLYLYLYELLNRIGTKDAEDGFRKLLWFQTNFRMLDRALDRNLKQWIMDYAVYYDLPKALVLPQFRTDPSWRPLIDLSGDMTSDEQKPGEDSAVFTALAQLSTYGLLRSKLYQSAHDLWVDSVVQVYHALQQEGGSDVMTGLFGSPETTRCYPMYNAVFFQREKRDAYYEYTISASLKYVCASGMWVCQKTGPRGKKSKLLGDVMKYADGRLRGMLGLKGRLAEPELPDPWKRCIDEALRTAVAAWKERKQARERAERVRAAQNIRIDFSSLSEIRRSAGETRELLLTEEERMSEETLPLAGEKHEPSLPRGKAAEKSEEREEKVHVQKTDFPLDPVECLFLEKLLAEEDGFAYLKSENRMASLVAEHINEVFYDLVGDTVLLTEGDSLELLTDYREDIAAFLEEGRAD